MFHYLTEWQFRTGDVDHWSGPEGHRYALVLKRPAKDAIGLFISEKRLSADYDYALIGTGSAKSITADQRTKDALWGVWGVKLEGNTLAELLVDLFCNHADPAGESGPKPIMPNPRMTTDLYFGGLIFRNRFAFDANSRHSQAVVGSIKRELSEVRQRAQAGLMNCPVVNEAGKVTGFLIGDTSGHRKHLKAICERYQIADYELLLPDGWSASEKPDPHGTSIGDSFSRADNTDLNNSDTGKTLNGEAGTWQWNELVGTELAISSGTLRAENSPTATDARAEIDLASPDHYCQAARVDQDNDARLTSVATRRSSSDLECYRYSLRLSTTDTHRLFHRDGSASSTLLGTVNESGLSNPVTFKLTSSGSAHQMNANSSDKGSPITNTTIPGNTRIGVAISGIGGAGIYAALDDLEAGDLAPSFLPAWAIQNNQIVGAGVY